MFLLYVIVFFCNVSTVLKLFMKAIMPVVIETFNFDGDAITLHTNLL